MFAEYRDNGDALGASIRQAQVIDLAGLPKKLQRNLKKAFDQANDVFGHLDKIAQTEKDLAAAAVPYAPLHKQVRTIQRRIVRIDAKIKTIDQIRSRSRGDAEAGLRKEIEHEILMLKAERKKLKTEIPTNWENARKKFVAIQKNRSHPPLAHLFPPHDH